MTAAALGLILIAATLHATWNLCAKRAGGGLPFVWLVGAVICAAYVPVVAGYLIWRRPEFPLSALGWILGSAVLKTSYSLFLQRSYRHGEFSLVYPLARGTGPLLSTFAAVAFLGERPSPLALAGSLAIVAAIFWLTGGFEVARDFFRRRNERAKPSEDKNAAYRRALGYGCTSGVFIAAYTLWDRHGVAGIGVPPILWDAGTALLQLAFLSPFAFSRRAEVAVEWRTKKRYVIAVALLSPMAYVLVLTVMRVTPVSYVASAREVSIVIGAFLGARVLKEGESRRRLLAALVMAVGVVALSLG